jgi:hypothetical protein
MAEIRVEPKRGGLGWLWLLIAAVIIAALAWYFLADREAATVPTTTGAPAAAPALALLDAARHAGAVLGA